MVPDIVANKMRTTIDLIKKVNDSIRQAIEIDARYGRTGRYEADCWQNQVISPQQRLSEYNQTIQKFIRLAADKGINGHHWLIEAGYEAPLEPSQKAQEWF